MKKIQKPGEGEYAPYASMYIDLLPDDGLVLQHLLDNLKLTKDLALSQSEDRLTHRSAPAEWTIKEILAHIIDDERIYTYRALRFARGDTTELPGFDQDAYAAASGANERSIEDILEELTAVRMATIAFFHSLEEEVFTRSGVSNGHRMSVRAAVYHIAGHELHHLNELQKNYSSGK
jgi:uncharacterized damage-inducible protein DinB